jgi:hypothetical protein
MFRLSMILLAVAVVFLAASPSTHAYVSTRGTMDTFSPGAACTPAGCPPISAAAYPGPGPMPSKISKCKAPPACGPMPMPCGPMPCPPPCVPCVTWY